MSTITREFTKEQLIKRLQHGIAVAARYPDLEQAQLDAEVFKIALASLEAEPVAFMVRHHHEHEGTGTLIHAEYQGRYQDRGNYHYTPLYTAPPAPVVSGEYGDAYQGAREDLAIWKRRALEAEKEVQRLSEINDYLVKEAQGEARMGEPVIREPAPVSVPDEVSWEDVPEDITEDDMALASAWAHGFNQCRAAMLQGAVQPQNQQQNIPENIPATQFKPVADLYGLTSPTGSETSFTFDAVEARDFIDGGWSVQEYVELKRYQEVILQGAEHVTTAYKLPDDFDFDRFNDVVWLEAVSSNPHMHSPTTSTIAMVALELNRKLADGNSPVIPDCWVACSERMPEQFKAILAFNEHGEVWSGAYDRYWNFYCDNLLVEHVTHWMPLPAAPQQEA